MARGRPGNNAGEPGGGLVRFVARTGLVFSLRICGAAAMFAVNLLVARQYGAEGLGIFAICIASLGLLTAGLPFGFNSVAAFFAAEYKSLNMPGLLNGYIRSAFFHIAAGALVALVAGAMALSILGELTGETVFLALCVWASAIAGAIVYVYGAIAIGLNQQFVGLFPEIIIKPALTLATIAAIAILWPATPIWAFMLMFAAGSWIAAAASYRLLRKPLKAVKATPGERDSVRWRRAAYPWTATTLLQDYMIDILLLAAGLIAPSVEIALLHVCFRFRMLAEFGVRSIQLMLIPDIASLKATGKIEAMRRRLGYANLATALYGVCALAGFALLGRWMLGLFGEEMVQGQGMLLIISSTLLIRAVFGPAPQILAIFDKHLSSAIAMACGLLVAIAIIFFLYPGHGIVSVAYAYFVANLLVAATLFIRARKSIGVDCSLLAVFLDIRLQAQTTG